MAVIRTVTVRLTAAPEPTQWEILADCPELGWHFFFGISRNDAPTQEQALEMAELWLRGEFQRQGHWQLDRRPGLPWLAPITTQEE